MFCSCRISTDKRVVRSLCHSRATCSFQKCDASAEAYLIPSPNPSYHPSVPFLTLPVWQLMWWAARASFIHSVSQFSSCTTMAYLQTTTVFCPSMQRPYTIKINTATTAVADAAYDDIDDDGYQSLYSEERRDVDVVDVCKQTFIFYPKSSVSTTLMITAGFYYTGKDCTVKCFCCKMNIMYFNDGDDPFTEHSSANPNCPFVRKQNLGTPPCRRPIVCWKHGHCLSKTDCLYYAHGNAATAMSISKSCMSYSLIYQQPSFVDIKITNSLLSFVIC